MAGVAVEIVKISVLSWLAWVVTGAVRRLFFHPLASIPGPRLAALTWWYEFYFDAIQPGQYIFKIQELHKQYGPIVRINPDEIHVNDVGFLDTVYAPYSVPRDKYEHQLSALRVPGGVGTTADYKLHKVRRDALAPFFSRKNILSMEPLIAKKVEQLSQKIGDYAAAGKPVNLSDVFFAFSNDVVTNFLFAHQIDILADESKAAELRHNSHNLLQGIHLNKHLPWIPDFLDSLPYSISKPMMPSGLIDMLALFERVRAELVSIMENKAASNKNEKQRDPAAKQSVYDAVLDDPALPAPQKTLTRLQEEGALLVLAGAESPAQTLSIVFFHLLTNPAILSKLRAELSTTSANSSWTELDKLPYLSAVIEEGNRLSFGVTARTARIAPGPVTYTPSQHVAGLSTNLKSYTIPGNTPISISTLSAHTAPTVFPDPYVFDPDRWLGEEGRERRKFQMAFGKGGRKCLGTELARAELCLVISTLVRKFDMELWETDESDVAFLYDFQVAMPKLESQGVRAVVKHA
ncbi:uncharacterized protein N7459_001850 [Penicillium hispanicum]|uniref:uncharacterized protein n=1 Tax=Penicillium hispanicum TaxID=1080232 RepID=UPI0025419344|nr:uncharacterized protein N7459_001850 [Penicillium hispanicum]KAJ5591481.1 hypothetical protein N7459_001850 [Penicillium hispanicum]